MKDLRVWWIAQVPGPNFYWNVDSVEEGVNAMNLLARYDEHQFVNKVKPDYCNAGGLQMFDELDKEDGPDGSWVDWADDETGEEDPELWLRAQTGDNTEDI